MARKTFPALDFEKLKKCQIIPLGIASVAVLIVFAALLSLMIYTDFFTFEVI